MCIHKKTFKRIDRFGPPLNVISSLAQNMINCNIVCTENNPETHTVFFIHYVFNLLCLHNVPKIKYTV